jgi:hypothetical protein
VDEFSQSIDGYQVGGCGIEFVLVVVSGHVKKPARPHRISDATLIPFQSHGLDDSVEQPALLGKAAHPSRRARGESGHGRYLR